MTDDLQEFDDFVSAGLKLVKQRDKQAWQLGDLACEFEVKVGRPSDPDAPTLGDLAHAWDVDTPRVSEWRSVAAFYPANVRTVELSWSHYNMARRRSDGSLENALELLDSAERLHLGIRPFKRFLNGEYFEGKVKRSDLAPHLQAMLPERIYEVWMTLKRITE
jgi:hypothetical protein